MILLRLLGGLALTRDGEPLSGRAAQRHRLALLALLGASRSNPVSRERLADILWPDAGDRARRLLSNSVHLIRKSLGDEAILGTADAIRLNPDRVRCDVREFDNALACGDLAVAIALYQGPFLDGFFLAGTPGFEAWVDLERERCARAYAQALETLATQCESAGDYRSAADWWHRILVLDPFAARTTLRRMRALEAVGEVEQAVQCAHAYDARVRAELRLEPDRAVMLFAERLIRERESHSDDATDPGGGAGTASAAERSSPATPTAISHGRGAGGPVRGWSRRRRTVYAAASVLAGAMVFVGVRAALGGGGPEPITPVEPSVAVLPLRNLGDGHGDAVLADGMTDEIIGRLARGGGLRVIARTSVFGFRGSEEDVRRIADSLGVSHVIEGSLQRTGSRIRVAVGLVDASDGSTRWSETYDREVRDIFQVQDDIARAVARELDVRLGDGAGPSTARPQTRNVAAYELYLRGSDDAALRSLGAAREAMENFRQAIALDPDYAAAYAGLARLSLRVMQSEASGTARRDLVAGAEEAALRAVALDDSLAEAHAALSLVRHVQWDMEAAETELRQAVTLDPIRARYREWLAALYTWTGRPEAALREAELALEQDPLSPSAHAEVAHVLTLMGRHDDALARLEPILELDPPLLRATTIAAHAYARKRMWPEAIALLERTGELGQAGDALLGYMYAQAGAKARALEIHDRLMEEWRGGRGSAFALALSNVGLADIDQALVWLERSVDDGSLPGPGSTRIAQLLFEHLDGEPGFQPVARRIGYQKR